MDKKSMIFSTVALSAVMLTSSLGYNVPLVKAAETQVTTESTDYKYDEELGGYIRYDGGTSIVVDNPDNPNVISIGTVHEDEDGNYYTNQDIVITSYNSKVDIYKGQTVKISDLDIKYSGYGSCTATFSNNSKEKKFSNTGTFTENVGVYCDGNLIKTLPITVYVKEADAPTITGVKDITCLYLNWNWDYTKDQNFGMDKWGNNLVRVDYSKWVGDPKTKQIYKLDKLLKKNVKAYDCYGKDITKSIKVTGFKYHKVGKEQTVVYTVTDSDGRTTTKKCKLLIKDTIKKMDKYMYVGYGTSVNLSPTPRGRNCYIDSGVFLKAGTKVHVVGFYKSKYAKSSYGMYKIEMKGKIYWVQENYLYNRKLKDSDYEYYYEQKIAKENNGYVSTKELKKYSGKWILSDSDCNRQEGYRGYGTPIRAGVEGNSSWNLVCECAEKAMIEFSLFGVYD